KVRDHTDPDLVEVALDRCHDDGLPSRGSATIIRDKTIVKACNHGPNRCRDVMFFCDTQLLYKPAPPCLLQHRDKDVKIEVLNRNTGCCCVCDDLFGLFAISPDQSF